MNEQPSAKSYLERAYEPPKDIAETDQFQMLEAQRHIMDYWAYTGKDPFGVEIIAEAKPDDLPPKVSQAWDAYRAFWDRMNKENIMP